MGEEIRFSRTKNEIFQQWERELEGENGIHKKEGKGEKRKKGYLRVASTFTGFSNHKLLH
jgi:hypothetical protein